MANPITKSVTGTGTVVQDTASTFSAVETAAAGANTYIVSKSQTAASLSLKGTGDKIVIQGASGEYTVKASGNLVTLKSDTQTITVTLPTATKAAAVVDSLYFLDGALSLSRTTSGYTLGTQKLSSSLKDVVATPSTDTTSLDHFSGTKFITGSVEASASGSTGQTFTLTTGQDLPVGTAGTDLYRGVAGAQVGFQDQTTLNSSDVIDGGAGDDTLAVNLTGSYQGGATVKNVETLQLGTNIATGPISFDYNVNAGAYEITGVKTVVADQITTGEALTVNNITPTGANNTAPVLSWQNEAGSRAGTIGVTYRQATIAGSADNQKVNLQNINAMNAGDGVLNIAGGMETITINSAGTVANNTLNNVAAAAADTAAANQVAVDVASAGTLSKVVLTGSVAIGKAAGVVTDTTGARAAFIGQTDRAVGNDMGLTADATTNATESNLLSVGARVTEVDASAMTGSANVRFVAKNDGSATNVTFKGGEAADYVEFEVGNINATGGKGNDTFAFINAQANSTFGEGDTIDGGEGSDTIQIGVNGNAQTYNISETELRNKSSVGTIDLRGQTTNLTLSSDFVAKADTADSITILTNKIIQSSATDAINPTAGANNGLENASTHTVNLTKLTANQSVSYTGGSGSDRIILNDANYNVLKTLVGGGNEGQVIAAGANRYDTITLVTNGENVVIDAQDLSKTSGFEGFVLTKNAATATYNITLTQAFLNNNTLATDDANTGIVETNFQIGTSAAANNTALGGAADTVTIDVRDLLSADNSQRAQGFTTRTFDVSSLENAGVNLQFIGNATVGNPTGALSLAQVRAAGIVTGAASANATDVTGLSQANPVGNAGRTLVFANADGNTTTGWDINSSLTATANNDIIDVRALTVIGTINGGAGVNTLSVRDGANISGAAQFANVTALTFDATGAVGATDLTMTAAQHAAISGTVTAAGTEQITISGDGAVTTFAAVETYVIGDDTTNARTVNVSALNTSVTASSANDAVTFSIPAGNFTGSIVGEGTVDDILSVTGATDISTATITNIEALTMAAGSSLTMTAAQLAGFSGTITAAGTQSVTVTTAVSGQAIGVAHLPVETITLNAAGTDTATVTTGAAAGFAGTLSLAGGGADTITINNVAVQAGDTAFVTITDFAADDRLALQVGGAANSQGVFRDNYTGAAVIGNVATGNVVEIDAATFTIGTFTNEAGVLAGLATLANPLVGAANASATVIVYNGLGQAGIYQVLENAGGAGTAFDVIELIGVVNATNNSLAAGNFA